MKSASTFDGPNQLFIVRRHCTESLVKIGNINTILGCEDFNQTFRTSSPGTRAWLKPFTNVFFD